jgi:hypothetical protein
VVVWSLVDYAPIQLNEWNALKQFYALHPRMGTAWELIPLSFVVDMFVDIGRFISQFDRRQVVRPGVIRTSGYSVKDTLEMKAIMFPGVLLSGSKIYGAPDVAISGTVTRKEYARVKASLLNIPSIEPIRIKLPNLSQVGTLAELVWSFMRGQR